MVIFAIISTLIALNINSLDRLTTDDLMQQKGIEIKKVEGTNIPYTNGEALYDEILAMDDATADYNIESSALYGYYDIDDVTRIHSIDVEAPWLSEFLKPSSIKEGRYPVTKYEIVVPETAFQERQLSGAGEALRTDLAIGQTMTFVNGDETIDLEIVGKFDDSSYDITNLDDDLWIFMDDEMFEEIIELFGGSTDDAFAYGISFVIEGLILTQETYDAANTLRDDVENILQNNPVYADWRDNVEGVPSVASSEDSAQIVLTIGFVVIGGVILATLFAYLISRFRRREIAILKAMGYAHSAVRSSLFAEILTTSFSGFIVGLGFAQGYLLYPAFDFGALIRLQAVAISFLIMVVLSLPGMFFASRRILGVSPAEAFRSNN
jgi:ABC-type antimicrobial peptide transport system permease subunit